MHPHMPKRDESTGWRERWSALANIPPLLSMVWDTSPPLLIASLALRLLRALVPIAVLWVGKLIIDLVVSSISSPQPDFSPAWPLVALEFALAIAGDVLGRAVSLIDSLLGDRFTNQVSVKLMLHASGLDLVSFEDPAFYDKLERARRQTTGRIGLLSSLFTIAQDLLTLISLTAGLVWFYPWLLMLLFVAVVPTFLGETHFAGLAYSLLYRWTPERRELDYVRMLGASLQSAKEVKIFGLGSYLAGRYRTLADRFYKENRRLAIQRASVGALLSLLGTGAYYAAYVVILQRAMGGSLTIGELTFLAASFARSRALIENLFGAASSISDQALYLSDLYDFFRMEPRIRSAKTALAPPRPIRTGFEFRAVSFRYPGAGSHVLKNVSFHLHADERIALIGENGAGKTTLVKLLARLYEPESGQILLDGIDLREYDVDLLRSEIGVIFQDYMRYDMLAKENIGFGRIEYLSDLSRIEDSAKKSLAHAVIADLPKGYDQMLGRRFDAGSDLSAGQWQKIALGRAYMREAQLIILDEPTASLDARAEYEVFQRFADLTRGKMAVLISHRFSTVRMADRILVLENGSILEQGSHEELIALAGRYAELFQLQAAGYR
ncbi:MAG: ABC transporter ATP-binding protein [Acidobacteriia bacterium]|nr:ABC transporter ATP-binding protein [Terriglobia bacterium]